MRIHNLLFLSLFAFGCGDGGPYHILVDSEFKEEEASVIKQSFLEWYGATGSDDGLISATYHYDIGHGFSINDWINSDELDPVFHRVNPDDDGLYYMKNICGECTGFAKHGEIIGILPEPYYVDGIFLRERFHAVVLHEIAHFIGLNDDEFEIGMSSTNAACLTDSTIETFCNKYDSCYDCARGTCF